MESVSISRATGHWLDHLNGIRFACGFRVRLAAIGNISITNVVEPTAAAAAVVPSSLLTPILFGSVSIFYDDHMHVRRNFRHGHNDL